MIFGTPSPGLGVEREQPPAPRPAVVDAAPALEAGATYDCGRHGKLTCAEIAAIAGTSKTAVYKRIHAGYRGEELCSKRWSRQSRVRSDSPPRRHMLVVAFKIALRFPDSLPTLAEVKQVRAMSDANAATWRQAIATARKEAGLEVAP